MDPLLITAASGMKARMESLDLLANNIANSGTNGFKADQEFYSTLKDAFNDELPVVKTRWTDFRQGIVVPTGNPLDLAIEGNGFLALNSPTGVVYTRNGALQISSVNQLATAEGYTVRNTRDKGRPITVDPARPVDIDRAGIVRQNGQELGQMELMGFQNATADLSKLGNSYFAQLDSASGTTAGTPSTAALHQGAIEQSNVPAADAAVRLVSVMRQFEMLQRAMSVGAEMNKRAIDEVARAS